MSKAKLVVESPSYKSLSDFGYNVAKRADAIRADGQWALDNIPNFIDGCPPESRVELNEGFRQRASELSTYSETIYGVVDGNYIPLDQLSGDAPKEQFKLNVAVAFSYSQQQVGAMKDDNLSMYNLVFDLRKRVNKYCSNRFKDLVNAAKNVIREKNPDSQSRAATLAFIEFTNKTLANMKTRCKSAEARGNDPTANSKALDAAIIAFNVKYESMTK